MDYHPPHTYTYDFPSPADAPLPLPTGPRAYSPPASPSRRNYYLAPPASYTYSANANANGKRHRGASFASSSHTHASASTSATHPHPSYHPHPHPHARRASSPFAPSPSPTASPYDADFGAYSDSDSDSDTDSLHPPNATRRASFDTRSLSSDSHSHTGRKPHGKTRYGHIPYPGEDAGAGLGLLGLGIAPYHYAASTTATATATAQYTPYLTASPTLAYDEDDEPAHHARQHQHRLLKKMHARGGRRGAAKRTIEGYGDDDEDVFESSDPSSPDLASPFASSPLLPTPNPTPTPTAFSESSAPWTSTPSAMTTTSTTTTPSTMTTPSTDMTAPSANSIVTSATPTPTSASSSLRRRWTAVSLTVGIALFRVRRRVRRRLSFGVAA